MGAIAIHFFVDTIPQDQMMSKLEPMRLHRMAGAVVEVPYFRMIEVRNTSLGHFQMKAGTDDQTRKYVW
jgi:hypothetical protein